MQLYLTGDDPPLVESTAHQVIAEMQGLNEIRDARIRGDLPRPEILVHPRLDIAAQLGVSVQSISQTIRIATLGDLPQNGAKFSLADRQIPIRVSLVDSARRDLTTLENLPVPTAVGRRRAAEDGRRLELRPGAVGGAPLQSEPARLPRGELEPRRRARHGDQEDLRAADAEASARTACTSVKTGNTEYFQEMIQNFALAMGAGVLMVLAVLVLLFARVFQPITILSALPLSLGGAALALVLTNKPFSLVGGDRLLDADGHRRQELHPAGGLRDRGDARRQAAARRRCSRRVTSARGRSS